MRGSAAMGGHHVAGAQKVQVVVPHFQLQLRQIAKVGGVITRKGVAAHIRYPAGNPSRTTECMPAVLPVARHVAIFPIYIKIAYKSMLKNDYDYNYLYFLHPKGLL